MPFSKCIRCMDCDGFPCLVHAKSDAEVIAVRPALTFSNVTLLTNARAMRLKTNPTGTAVTEVVVDHNGVRETFGAGVVVVSCGAANSARLLLASGNDHHPRGLANGSDQVGRNYMFHNSTAVLAVSKEPNPTRYQKTLGLNGGEKHIAKLAPLFSLQELATHAVDFWLSTEDLPNPENRVTLERDGNIRLSYTKSNDVAPLHGSAGVSLRGLLGGAAAIALALAALSIAIGRADAIRIVHSDRRPRTGSRAPKATTIPAT
jgi:choline dehydrogenase-like flavoprotein